MAVYRYQVVSVGWWRGKIKRWNTTFHTNSASDLSAIHTHMQNTCYPNPGDVTGDCSGGVASISRYAASGGAPLQQVVYFDWQTPSEWIPFVGSVWSSLDPQPAIDASGESALVIIGNMSGLSASGKPVTTRKFIHAVPSRSAVDYADPDVSSAVQTAILSEWPTGAWFANPAGIVPASVEVSPWYLNHQRVRGRRRTTSQVAAQSFSAGVVTGTEAGGGASAPQFQ